MGLAYMRRLSTPFWSSHIFSSGNTWIAQPFALAVTYPSTFRPGLMINHGWISSIESVLTRLAGSLKAMNVIMAPVLMQESILRPILVMFTPIFESKQKAFGYRYLARLKLQEIQLERALGMPHKRPNLMWHPRDCGDPSFGEPFEVCYGLEYTNYNAAYIHFPKYNKRECASNVRMDLGLSPEIVLLLNDISILKMITIDC
jgi:hypothetical protein